MPIWLTILTSVISTVIAICGFLGINAYMQTRAKHKAELKNAEEDKKRAAEQKKIDDLKKLEQQAKEERFKKLIQTEIAPIKQEIAEIKENTKSSLEADVLALRCNMKTIEERCKAQGFSDIGDKATMKKLRCKYEGLGGNDFRDYVNRWCEIVESLPDEIIKK